VTDASTELAEQAIRFISEDRVRAHEVVFAHRRIDENGKHIDSAPFHPTLIRAIHSDHPRVVVEAFRKAAKSTLTEEAVVLMAALKEFQNCVVIGASYARAVERLESIGHEIETNEDIIQAFGVLKGDRTWTESKKVLSNGVILQAIGAGQSLRGVKYHQYPPDFVMIDDLEDEESTRTPAAREFMKNWLYTTLIAALAKHARIRFLGNRLDPDAVIVKIANDRKWLPFRYPIMTKDLKTGEDVATWPAQFPLEWVYDKREELQRMGLYEGFNQEYMCEADAPESKIFRPEHFANVVKPRIRTWEACYAMVDPAKSSNKRSATTAIPVWSWLGHRLVVWECRIGSWAPDGIIDQIFQIDTLYRPVFIGIEEDSLNEFIMQPLRQAQTRLSHVVPFRRMQAKKFTEGRGKTMFIESLQPFFAANEVDFAQPMPDLTAQFLSFPKGAIDGPNALAYAPRLRPGQPVYDEFGSQNVTESLNIAPSRPVYLAMHATQEMTVAILVQFDGTSLHIFADWVEEGDPGRSAAALVRVAGLEARGRIQPVAPAQHFHQWTNVGLQAALARVPIALTHGGDRLAGQGEIRELFRRQVRGMPAIQVAHAARWTLNAFSGGYAQNAKAPDSFAEKAYGCIMEAIECFAALLKVESSFEDDDDLNWREGVGGRRYVSAMPTR
jgi:hypothetical protein